MVQGSGTRPSLYTVMEGGLKSLSAINILFKLHTMLICLF